MRRAVGASLARERGGLSDNGLVFEAHLHHSSKGLFNQRIDLFSCCLLVIVHFVVSSADHGELGDLAKW
jgi:hypothetical protein